MQDRIERGEVVTMRITVYDEKQGVSQIGLDQVPQSLPTDRFFWLDIDGASTDEIAAAATALNISEPILSWLPRFGQRPRFEVDEDQIRISTFAASASGQPVEAHFLYTKSRLLTVHSGIGHTMDRARTLISGITARVALGPVAVALLILNELMYSFDPVLEAADGLLNDLEDQVLRVPREEQLLKLSALRKQMWSLHRLWEPQYEASKNFSATISAVPALSGNSQHLQDYAERIADLMDKIDDLRQRANEAMSSYSQSVSFRQSQIINRLTIITAVFLPMTFLTGYFGMNFQWFINGLQSKSAFFLLGIGLFLASLLSTVLMFKWRGVFKQGATEKLQEESKATTTEAAQESNISKKQI